MGDTKPRSGKSKLVRNVGLGAAAAGLALTLSPTAEDKNKHADVPNHAPIYPVGHFAIAYVSSTSSFTTPQFFIMSTSTTPST